MNTQALEIIFTLITFSFIPLAIKSVNATPESIGFIRLVMTVILFIAFFYKKIEFKKINQALFGKLFLIGVLFFGHWITYNYAIKYAGPSLCVLGMSTYGIQLVLWGRFFLGHQIQRITILTLFLIILGIFFVIPDWSLKSQSSAGLLFAVVSASFYSCIPIILQKTKNINFETRVFFQFGVAMLGFLFFAKDVSIEAFSFQDWVLMLFLGIVGTFMAHSLWAKITSQINTHLSAILYYTVTPGTMILAALLFQERLSQRQWYGATIILTASFINIYFQKRKVRA